MKTTLDTPVARRASLALADANARIEGIRHDPVSDPIFEAWVKNDLTEAQALAALDALDLQRERAAHSRARALAAER